jgi:hypothetical protein
MTRHEAQQSVRVVILAALVLAAATPEEGGFKLESVRREAQWAYTDDVTLEEYRQTISWREPDPATFRWIIAKAGKIDGPRPLGLGLHSWGGSREKGWLWWYNGRIDGGGSGGYRGAILVATDHSPASFHEERRNQYDWWTGVRLSDGKVHPVTQDRLLAGLDFALQTEDADRSRVFVWGNSMGGAGAAQMAVAHPERFAFAISGVGLYVPSLSPTFRSSYERVWGKFAREHPKFVADGRDVWEHYDLAKRVREEPGRDLPLIIFANGRRDRGIGWEQAALFVRALQEARQPHVFRWTNSGHDTRPLLPGRAAIGQRDLGIDVRLDQSLPAFAHGSLDDDPGSGDPTDGDPEGQVNLYLGWEPDQVVETTDRWEAVLWLSKASAKDGCVVDVTPRRCRKFRPQPGDRFRWKSGEQWGDVAADRYGLVTAPQVRVTKAGVHLTIERSPLPARRPAS